MLTRSPGVVGRCKGGAAADGGMAKGPELDEAVGVGIGQGLFAEDLEGVLRGGLGVGDDAVDSFLAVDVGGVLDVAAVAVDDGIAEERQYREDEQQHYERGPVVLRGDVPVCAIPSDKPLHSVVAEIELDQEKHAEEDQRVRNVVEDVVAHLVAEDVGDLVGGGFGDGVVPYDDAFGGSDAGDVGVEAGDLLAGLHQKHAVWRDVDAATLNDPFQTIDQIGVGLRQRLEFVEERIDEYRDHEDTENNGDDGRNPEPEPPSGG